MMLAAPKSVRTLPLNSKHEPALRCASNSSKPNRGIQVRIWPTIGAPAAGITPRNAAQWRFRFVSNATCRKSAFRPFWMRTARSYRQSVRVINLTKQLLACQHIRVFFFLLPTSCIRGGVRVFSLLIGWSSSRPISVRPISRSYRCRSRRAWRRAAAGRWARRSAQEPSRPGLRRWRESPSRLPFCEL